MKIAHFVIAASLGVVGGIMLVECCPKAKQLLEKGKNMLKKQTN